MQTRLIYSGGCVLICCLTLLLILFSWRESPTALQDESEGRPSATIGYRDCWYDLSFSPEGEAWGVSSAGIFRKLQNTDLTWEPFDITGSSYLYSIHLASSHRIWAAGEKGLLLYSADGGKSWRSHFLTEVTLFSIDFADSLTGMVAGEQGKIFKTTNGQDWSDVSLGVDLNLEDVELFDTKVGWVVGEEGSIWCTRNGGETWIRQTQSLTKSSLYSVKFISIKQGWVVGMGGTILFTQDKGKSWIRLKSPTTNNLYSIDIQDSLGIIVGARGTVLLSRDGGSNWEIVALKEAEGVDLISTYLVPDFSKSVAWLAGTRGFFYEWKIPERIN